MDEYLSRDDVLRKFIEGDGHDDDRFTEGYNFAVQECRGEAKKIPAADVQPVRHGRWTDNVYKYVKSLDAYFIQAKCSVCGRYSDRIDIYSRFMSNECCSRCGARMDGEQNDNSET